MKTKRIYKDLPKELIECEKCHWALPLSEFYKNKRYKSGYRETCIKCYQINVTTKPGYSEGNRLAASKFRKKNPRKARSYQLMGIYGITQVFRNRPPRIARQSC